jgi:hypothetical protein
MSAAPSGAGRWQWQTVQRSRGPFADLLRALRTPTSTSSPGKVCPDIAAAPLVLSLTDAADTR